MPHSSHSVASKPDCSLVRLICVLLSFSALNTYAKIALTVPERVSLSPDMNTQTLSISWLGGAATTFDLIILRTEFNETVFYDTVSATMNHVTGLHQWNWTSVEPLECTSLSIKIRSRDGQATSEWSKTQILQGSDIPSNTDIQVYPRVRVVPVGANTTFCCIMGEGRLLARMLYGSTTMNVTQLSRRTYATTAVNQEQSHFSGTNILCLSTKSGDLSGAVVFVGYPPLPTDFVCETHDLISAVCNWKEGRDTHLLGRRRTIYQVNERNCIESSQLKCSLPQWDGKWTLVASNPLGSYSLTDSAELSHRVRPVEPSNLSGVVHAWNATLQWRWKYSGYSSLNLICRVELNTSDYNTKRVFTGEGLRSVVLSDLRPYEDYSVRVSCGHHEMFWKWGNWSRPFSFKTKTYVPDAPDLWMWMNRDNTGSVFWKPLMRHQSHGHITGYEVTLWNPEEGLQHTQIVPPDTYSIPVNVTQMTSFSSDATVIATIIAKNVEGMSQPASVPLIMRDVEPSDLSRIVYSNSVFSLSWQRKDSTTCSYLVEWLNASCTYDCPVEWLRVAAGSTNVSVQSANFQPGVRYNFSLYRCPSDSPQLLQRWQGYTRELPPSSSVKLSISQESSDVILTWEEIPLAHRRGFLLGYNVYINNGTQLTLIANLSDVKTRTYVLKDLTVGIYKFTVKAYTSAGEDTGSTASFTMEQYKGLILEMLASLGIITMLLVIVTFICFKKRKWVKKAFYPDIPEPKLPSDWSRTQGPLDIKPSPHSMVHIVEKPERDSSKEALVVIPEEDEDYEGQGIEDESIETDEPLALRYYNQVVDERPIRPRYPDSSISSASSLDSAHTDVTYTGIQTSSSSLVFQPDQQCYSEGHQPQVDCAASCGGGAGGYQPQMHPKVSGDDVGLGSPEFFSEPQACSSGGYKPQNFCHLDSPTEVCERGSLAPSLGSPTSVSSTQFLLPDGDEHAEDKRQLSSWFTNLLSSTKP